MTKKEYNRFIDILFHIKNKRIYSISIDYYNKNTRRNDYKLINSPRGIIGKPYVNGYNMLIDPGSVFDAIEPIEDIEINGDYILFHCGEKIKEKQKIKIDGITYYGTVTIGYEKHDFLINRKYIANYHINYIA